MHSMLRGLAACAVLLTAALTTTAAPAYPERTVKIIVPFAAGGPTDVIARLIAQQLSNRLGQQFYVENLPGAGGNIGMAGAARAAPDGYTILIASSSYVVNPSLYKNCPYDPNSFVPVTLAAVTPNVLIVNPSIPAQSAQELLALLKANPGKYTFASPGIGTTPHLASELFRSTYHLDFAIATYRGGAPATEAVLANEAPIAFVAMSTTTPLVKAGQLRALAVTARKRSSALSEIPTSTETGLSGQESETMQGVFVPSGTPNAIADLLQREIATIVNMPDVKSKMLPLGFEPVGSSSTEFSAYIAAEIAKWKGVIMDAKIPQIP
ncbi:MAG: tripartite tricarboxylate transporter substrate binding protein [Bradyrhizobiaceae bacterium]|nr:tripartite tricarboxylate transporter substrate binding protein [Bradyrhizobiaceae bacterium]